MNHGGGVLGEQCRRITGHYSVRLFGEGFAPISGELTMDSRNKGTVAQLIQSAPLVPCGAKPFGDLSQRHRAMCVLERARSGGLERIAVVDLRNGNGAHLVEDVNRRRTAHVVITPVAP